MRRLTQLTIASLMMFRRRTEGNMRFNDNGTCIGPEPDWHIRKRHRASKLTRESRERKKEREERLRKSGMPFPPKKKYPRRRKESRRLPRVNISPGHETD